MAEEEVPNQGATGTRPLGETPLTAETDSDPFAEQTRLYRKNCPRPPAGGLGAGRHDAGYWRSLLPGHLAFLGDHLAA